VDVPTPLDLDHPRWEERLRERAKEAGKLDRPWAIDYFVFPKGEWTEMPPFVVGRTTWDNYLIHDALSRGFAVVDSTKAVLAVHQSHAVSGATTMKLAEISVNRSLHDASFGRTTDAQWRLTPRMLRPAWDLTRLQRKLEVFFKQHPSVLPVRIEKTARRLIRKLSR
jgi:hypothetical protein